MHQSEPVSETPGMKRVAASSRNADNKTSRQDSNIVNQGRKGIPDDQVPKEVIYTKNCEAWEDENCNDENCRYWAHIGDCEN